MPQYVERSWHMRLYNKLYDIAPVPADQGPFGTCNFYAIGKGTEMQVKKLFADDEMPCDITVNPEANVNDYCHRNQISKFDIDTKRDIHRDSRMHEIIQIAKQLGVEASSSTWPSPKRIKVKNLLFLGEKMDYDELNSLLEAGNAVMCQIIVSPDFYKLRPDQVWSCEPRFDEHNNLLYPYSYHVVIILGCGERNDPVTILNSNDGIRFCAGGFGHILLAEARWFRRFHVEYPLQFIPQHGPSSKQTDQKDASIDSESKRPKNTAESSSYLRVGDRSTIDAPRWKPNAAAATSTKMPCRSGVAVPTDVRHAATTLQPIMVDRSTIDAPRWRTNDAAETVVRHAALTRSNIDAPRWRPNHGGASTSRSNRKDAALSVQHFDEPKPIVSSGSRVTTQKVHSCPTDLVVSAQLDQSKDADDVVRNVSTKDLICKEREEHDFIPLSDVTVPDEISSTNEPAENASGSGAPFCISQSAVVSKSAQSPLSILETSSSLVDTGRMVCPTENGSNLFPNPQ